MRRIIVSKRFGEWVDVRDFIRPHDYMLSSVLATRPGWTVEELWRWVIEHIRYPRGGVLTADCHVLYTYGKRYASIDYWSYPAETLRTGIGDCEDSAILLVSMLRHIDQFAYATVGFYEGHGHVWVSISRGSDWLVLDTTLSRVPLVVPVESAARQYRPLFRFNEKEVVIEAAEMLIPKRTYWYMIVEG